MITTINNKPFIATFYCFASLPPNAKLLQTLPSHFCHLSPLHGVAETDPSISKLLYTLTGPTGRKIFIILKISALLGRISLSATISKLLILAGSVSQPPKIKSRLIELIIGKRLAI